MSTKTQTIWTGIKYEGTDELVPCRCPSDCGCKPWTSVPNYCGCIQPH